MMLGPIPTSENIKRPSMNTLTIAMSPKASAIEQPPEHQVARETQDLSAAVPEHRPQRATADLRPEAFERRSFGRWMHGASFSAHRVRALGPLPAAAATAQEKREIERHLPQDVEGQSEGGGERAAPAART